MKTLGKIFGTILVLFVLGSGLASACTSCVAMASSNGSISKFGAGLGLVTIVVTYILGRILFHESTPESKGSAAIVFFKKDD